MDFFRRPIFLGIIAMAIALTVAWQFVDGQRTKQSKEQQKGQTVEQPKIVDLTNADPTDFDSVIDSEYKLALSKADESNPNLKIAAVSYELPGSLFPNKGTSRYIFTAENDSQNNWVITFSQNSASYIRALIPKDDYLGPLQSMNTKFWKFNYVTALQITEKNGGQEWREKNKLLGIKMTLRHLAPNNWLLWKVEYQGESLDFAKTIDANSGQIIDESLEGNNSEQ